MVKDLHELPRLSDGLSHLYVEHCRIEQDAKAIAIHDAEGKISVPSASLACIMLGPGTSVSHSAIKTLADSNCIIIWCGEGSVKFYAYGQGGTRNARSIIHQAKLASYPELRIKVVKRLYKMRFSEKLSDNLSIRQIQGMEGIRIRKAYSDASEKYGVPWTGRNYERRKWGTGNKINIALSTGNSCLYGICHSAIVTAGYSPALGFIHIGKQMSFVYDIADLYKSETSIPIAFKMVSEKTENIEQAVRRACRDIFFSNRLLARIIPDIKYALDFDNTDRDKTEFNIDDDPALPIPLWVPNEKNE